MQRKVSLLLQEVLGAFRSRHRCFLQQNSYTQMSGKLLRKSTWRFFADFVKERLLAVTLKPCA